MNIHWYFLDMVVKLMYDSTSASDFSKTLLNFMSVLFCTIWLVTAKVTDWRLDHVSVEWFHIDYIDGLFEASLILEVIVYHWAIVAGIIYLQS